MFKWLNHDELLQDEAWWDIYIRSFPQCERDPREDILAAAKNQRVWIGSYQVNGQTAAIAVMYPMHTLPFVFLNYFAVDHHLRGQSLGSRLFQSLLLTAKQRYAAHHHTYLGLIWEIEDPNEAISPTERALRQRRIDFYQRHGAQLFQSRFIQPPVDGTNCITLRLMYCQKEKIHDFATEQAITRVIYFDKYATVNHIHSSLINKLLIRCAEENSLCGIPAVA